MRQQAIRALLAAALILGLVGGVVVIVQDGDRVNRIHAVGYFANSTGVFVGDEVRILGVPVGRIDAIEPSGSTVKISFSYNNSHKVPADAAAVILSPSLVPTRAIQLTPAYTSGPVLPDGAVIPADRTVVPVEWDDLREQLDKLSRTLEPTQPGGVSTLGAALTTAADNLRGQGTNIRQTLIELSQAFSALGDHSDDIFGTVKNLSILVSALKSSASAITDLNSNLASTTALFANDPGEVGRAVHDVQDVLADVQSFVAANRETVGTTSDKLASITTAATQSIDDLKQALHVAPNTVQNFLNIYHPAQGSLSGSIALNNFANPISFICGAVQAASRLNAEQSAKLCVQYLAPIIKNRQFNFPPLGVNPFVGAMARPNELTYSEDWLRPDYVPPQAAPSPTQALPPLPAEVQTQAGAQEAQQPDAADGIRRLMAPPGGGS